MAALNILIQPPSPWQLTTASTLPSICKYNINTICQKCASVSNSICKCGRTTATAKSKLSTPQMFPQRPHLSGSGCSWMQDNLPFYDNVTTNGRTRSPLYSVFPTSPAQVSSVQDLFEFICTGPLVRKTNLTPEKVSESIDKWILYGSQLCRLFQLNELFLTERQKVRIYHYYIPVFMWCEQEISHHYSMFQQGDDIPPLVIGFSAPQGCGKTTLVFALDFLFRMTGRNSATRFLFNSRRSGITIPEMHFWSFVVMLGAMIFLCLLRLTALGKLTKEGMKIKLPRYDKDGRGDRADPSMWPEVEGPLTVLLFEGWMLGFKPHLTEAVKAVDPQLETVDKNLEAYYDAWDRFINSWIVIKIQDPSYVYQWRLQAEIAMRADGKPGMSDEEVYLVMDFVLRYLPAYKAYLPTLYSEGPNGLNPEHLLVVEIDEGRNPILGN